MSDVIAFVEHIYIIFCCFDEKEYKEINNLILLNIYQKITNEIRTLEHCKWLHALVTFCSTRRFFHKFILRKQWNNFH